MARGHDSIAGRLYRGEVSYDFIGRRRWWYIASGVVVLISVLSLGVRGLHASIDFRGGAVFEPPANGHSVSDARTAVTDAGVSDPIVQKIGGNKFRIETLKLSETQVNQVEKSLVKRLGLQNTGQVSTSTVGSTWGSQITRKAVEGLVVFLVVVLIYLSFRFEPKMALAAFIALIHDLLITAGIYSLVGFEVSPSTVIALLTILGYSLYDTVVVFDKVRENTQGLAGSSRMTFSQAANLAVNQTLVRSINTSLIALMPVAGLLFVGAGLLGAGTLKDLALALFIGLASGAYSSIFIATPLLCDFKEREPQFIALARRVAARQGTTSTRPVLAGAGGPSIALGPEPRSQRAEPVAAAGNSAAEDEPAAASRPEPRPGTPPRAGGPARQDPRRRKGGRGGRSRKRRR